MCGACHLRFPVMEDSVEELLERVGSVRCAEVEGILRGCFQLVPGRRKSASALKRSVWWEDRAEVGV